MRTYVRRHPFTLIGILTLVFFFAVQPAGRLLMVFIVPAYLVWMLAASLHVAIAGPSGFPGLLGILVSGAGMAAGLLPYFLADYLWNRWRSGRS